MFARFNAIAHIMVSWISVSSPFNVGTFSNTLDNPGSIQTKKEPKILKNSLKCI